MYIATVHHRRHLSVGFMREPAGQLKAAAKSALFTMGPMTLCVQREVSHQVSN